MKVADHLLLPHIKWTVTKLKKKKKLKKVSGRQLILLGQIKNFAFIKLQNYRFIKLT